MKVAPFIIMVAFLATTPALAQAIGPEAAACKSDAQRFCKHALDGGPFTVAACLASHKSEIAAKCRAVLKAHGL